MERDVIYGEPRMRKNKLNVIDLVEKQERLVAQAIKEMIVIARLQKAEYDALVAEGFSPEQAIELCKKL